MHRSWVLVSMTEPELSAPSGTIDRWDTLRGSWLSLVGVPRAERCRGHLRTQYLPLELLYCWC